MSIIFSFILCGPRLGPSRARGPGLLMFEPPEYFAPR